MEKTIIKVGAMIRSKGYFSGLEGRVNRIIEGQDREWHGTVEITVTKNTRPEFWSWVGVGDLEHFCHFEWEKDLEIITETEDL